MIEQRFYGSIKSCINAKCLRCRIASVFGDCRGNSSRFPELCVRAERNSLRETSGKYTDESNFELTRSHALSLLKLKLDISIELDVSINYYERIRSTNSLFLSLSLTPFLSFSHSRLQLLATVSASLVISN